MQAFATANDEIKPCLSPTRQRTNLIDMPSLDAGIAV